MFKTLDFKPLPGFSSPHLQMIFANYGPRGKEPPSKSTLIKLSDGDVLSCEVSTPAKWSEGSRTIIMVHGVGGSHQSPYMIRLSRKFFAAGNRVVRINLRGAGSGEGLNNKPYNCGTSHDVWEVVKFLKNETPKTKINVLGFSLGGSVALKMGGELGEEANEHIDRIMAVCPVLDLIHTVKKISLKSNWIYHQYYLKKVLEQGRRWVGDKVIPTLKAFDDHVTAPLWGYEDADDYYRRCSSFQFIPSIKVPCKILLAADDPFIDPHALHDVQLPSNAHIWVTSHGGHMGYIGWGNNQQGPYWMDKQLMEWNH